MSRSEIEKIRAEEELSFHEDKMYTIILMTFGALSLAVSASAIALAEFTVPPQYAAFGAIGLMLFTSGSAWYNYEKHRIKRAQERLDELKAGEFDGIRKSSDSYNPH